MPTVADVGNQSQDPDSTQRLNTMFIAIVIVTGALLVVFAVLVAAVIGMKYLRKRHDVKMPKLSGVKLPSLNGSQKYTIIPGNDNCGLELQDGSCSESETDILDQMTTV